MSALVAVVQSAKHLADNSLPLEFSFDSDNQRVPVRGCLILNHSLEVILYHKVEEIRSVTLPVFLPSTKTYSFPRTSNSRPQTSTLT